MFNTTCNNSSIRYWEYVGYTITSINYNTCQIIWRKWIRFWIWTSNLRVESKNSLDTNEESFYSKGFEHNLSHLLSIFWRVHGRFCQNKSMLFWLTSQIWINTLVPKLFYSFPIFNLSWFHYVTKLMRFTMSHSFISNVVIQVYIFIFASFLYQ